MEFAFVTALWLGVLTSISPCPLATNIAAMSFISRDVSRAARILKSSIGYIAGRTIVYIALAVIVIFGVLSIPGISQFLQKYMSRILGPLLIVVALVLLNWIRIRLPSFAPGSAKGEQAARGGWWSAIALGALFALSFCPVSAALYFGSLIPLAVDHGSVVVLPGLYGVGTAVPAVIFAVAIAFSTQQVGKWFNRMAAIERWARPITGLIFLLAGIHLTLSSWFGVDVITAMYTL